MQPDDRVRAKVGSILFGYKYPEVTVDTQSRTKVHEPVGEAPVVQHLGPAETTISIRGHCYLDAAEKINKFSRKERVRVRTEEYRGWAVVESTSVEPEGAVGGHGQRRDDWRYVYDLELTEVSDKNYGLN